MSTTRNRAHIGETLSSQCFLMHAISMWRRVFVCFFFSCSRKRSQLLLSSVRNEVEESRAVRSPDTARTIGGRACFRTICCLRSCPSRFQPASTNSNHPHLCRAESMLLQCSSGGFCCSYAFGPQRCQLFSCDKVFWHHHS